MSEENFVIVEERGNAGLITLNRPKALNALSLGMVRQIAAALLKWRDQGNIQLVAIRGMGKAADGSFQPFGSFCAGGDIRFFHQAALAGDPALEDFFTEEYSLNHLIHTYPKPYVAFMDGICMGGGMGLCQGRALAAPFGEYVERANRAGPVARPDNGDGGVIRIVTERSKLAMPETMIGLFPDVGGGYFLSRCMNSTPGVGEYLALTGELMHAADALAVGLADVQISPADLLSLWESIAQSTPTRDSLLAQIAPKSIAPHAKNTLAVVLKRLKIEAIFGSGSLAQIMAKLQADDSDWAQLAANALRKRSPLMLHVTLELIRRARSMSLADDLRLERDLVRHCFHTQHLQRSGASSETVEGIRALAVDKDHSPKWHPARIEDIAPEMIAPFFVSPWPKAAHPLRDLA